MRFEFATATRIVFGAGTVREIGKLAAELLGGQPSARALIVTGRPAESVGPLAERLAAEGIAATTFSVEAEPTTTLVQEGVRVAREASCDLVIGFGGGSAIDAGKAVAALLANPGNLLDYLEVVGRNQPLPKAPLPYLAVPTTAGTGAEVTRNAVLAVPEHGVKVSLRSPLLLPRVALVDPELTYDLPPAVTAATGLDALTQLIEAFVSVRANPMTDALCREGIRRAARSLERAFDDGRDAAAREDLSLAALFGGMALANAGLGAVHGFAAPLGGMFPAPHGAVCAALLPHVMAANVRALRDRDPAGPFLGRYTEVAQLLLNEPTATADRGIEWIAEQCRRLAIPPLRRYGVTAADVPALIEKGLAASSMKGNPIALAPEELREILARSL